MFLPAPPLGRFVQVLNGIYHTCANVCTNCMCDSRSLSVQCMYSLVISELDSRNVSPTTSGQILQVYPIHPVPEYQKSKVRFHPCGAPSQGFRTSMDMCTGRFPHGKACEVLWLARFEFEQVGSFFYDMEFNLCFSRFNTHWLV